MKTLEPFMKGAEWIYTGKKECVPDIEMKEVPETLLQM